MARTATKTRAREKVTVIRQPKPKLPAIANQARNPRAVIGNNSAAQTAQMLSVVAKAAADPNVHVDKMRAILDMQKELIAEQARREFNDAFRLMRRNIPTINADGRIVILGKDASGKRTGPKQQDTPYATYPNIMKVCVPIMDQQGFSMWHSTEPHPTDLGRLIVIGYLEHTSGHQRKSMFPLPHDVTGSKNNLQGWGSAQHYGRRYTAIALLNIISHAKADQDNNGANAGPPVEQAKEEAEKPTPTPTEQGEPVPTITQEQLDQLIEKMESCGVPRAKVLAHYQIPTLNLLPAEMFTAAIQACDDYKIKTEEAARKRS